MTARRDFLKLLGMGAAVMSALPISTTADALTVTEPIMDRPLLTQYPRCLGTEGEIVHLNMPEPFNAVSSRRESDYIPRPQRPTILVACTLCAKMTDDDAAFYAQRAAEIRVGLTIPAKRKRRR